VPKRTDLKRILIMVGADPRSGGVRVRYCRGEGRARRCGARVTMVVRQLEPATIMTIRSWRTGPTSNR